MGKKGRWCPQSIIQLSFVADCDAGLYFIILTFCQTNSAAKVMALRSTGRDTRVQGESSARLEM